MQASDQPSRTGGRRQGGGERGRLGPKDRIPYRTANRPPVSNQRPPEILDGRHPPGGSLRDTGRRHPTRPARAGMGWRRGEGVPHPGRVRTSSSWLPEPLGQGRHKTQAQLFVPHFSGTPEGWNHVQRRACSIWNSREPEQRRGESSGSPSPQRDRTSNLNKRTPPPACVREEIRGTEETGKQKPNKQREPLQKGPVQRIKIPVDNTDYTGRGL